jgi:glutamine amidotransferase
VTVTIVDYGAGNLTSVRAAFAAVGATPTLARSPSDLDGSGAIVIPGVGHFAATAGLDAAWRVALLARVGAGASVLGICLGMQWLFDGSAEAPLASGLGVFTGRCFRLTGDVKVPHVGWNSLDGLASTSRLLSGLPNGATMYFTHAFGAPVSADTVASTTHGVTFASVAERGRLFATQGHPEKSSAVGLRILSNFVAAARDARC